jgi:hypothetical protein
VGPSGDRKPRRRTHAAHADADKMRILFIAHRFPYPPTFGSKVRSFHMIRHLAQAHDVSVVSLTRGQDERAQADGIAPYCRSFEAFPVNEWVQLAKVAATLPTPLSASEAYFHSSAMQRRIRTLLASRSFDLLVVHCSSVGHYVSGADGLPKVIDYCDVDSQKWSDYAGVRPWPLSWGYRWEALRVRRAERRLGERFSAVTLATAGEAALLRSLGVRGEIDWFPNGVDLDHFRPASQGYDPNVLTFVGRMDYFPNEQCMVDFCRDVLPLLRRRRPALRLQIVGAHPTPRVRRLAALPGVTVTGAVPDVRPFVQGSALTIAPLAVARGTQNKILESMAMGVPVVASRVAAAGVDATAGEHLLVADDAQGYCDAIERLVGDARFRARVGEAGRARVESHHTWSAAMAKFDGIVRRSIQAVSK